MTASTIPDPAPGQVWEDRYHPWRRVRIDPPAYTPYPTDGFMCTTVAHRRPHLVGSPAWLSRTTLRTKWRLIEEAS